jgi:MarR family transcriptional regulator, temperature-dependent positive regulator of motility
MTKATKATKSDTRIDQIHARLLQKSDYRIGYSMSIWANYHTLRLLPMMEQDYGMLRDEFNILFCLADGGPVTGTEVCRIIGRPRNSISRSADRLVRRKLIKVREAGEDRRQTVFEITRAGRQIYRSMLPLFIAQQEQMLAALTPQDRADLDRILAILLASHGEWDRIPDLPAVRRGRSTNSGTQRQSLKSLATST